MYQHNRQPEEQAQHKSTGNIVRRNTRSRTMTRLGAKVGPSLTYPSRSSREDCQLWMPTPEIPGHRRGCQQIPNQDGRPGQRLQHLLREDQADPDKTELKQHEEQQDAEADVWISLGQPEEPSCSPAEHDEDEPVHPGKPQHHLKGDWEALRRGQALSSAEKCRSQDSGG